MVKNPPANAGDTGLIPASQRSHMLHGNYTPIPQLLNHSLVLPPQLLKPLCLEPALRNKGRHHSVPNREQLWLASATESPHRASKPQSCCYVLSHFSRIQLCATLWTVAYQAPLSMGFSRQEYWSGLPFPSPGDLPDPGIEPVSLTPNLR